MPLLRTFALSTKKGREASIEPVVDRSSKTIRYLVHPDARGVTAGSKEGRGVSFRCLVCGQVAPEAHIKAEGDAGRMAARLVAIIAEGPRSRVFLSPTDEQEAIARSAVPAWKPSEPIAINPRDIRSQLYGLDTFGDLFSARQLVGLTTLADLVELAAARVKADAERANQGDPVGYSTAVATYLALAVGRSANYWSSLAPWGGDFIVQTFGRQAIPMVWDYAEANPFSDGTGNWMGAIDWVSRVIDVSAPATMAVGTATQNDAATTVRSGRFLVATDPPYYDNIIYADLADYFYVWLRRAIGFEYPKLFATVLTPKTEEIVAAPTRFEGNATIAKEHFELGLRASFDRIREELDPEYPFTFFYAFKQAESSPTQVAPASTGWETMLQGLLAAGFSVGGTWPMRTERDQGLKTGDNVLASSVVLVCRPLGDGAPITNRRGYHAALKAELPEAIRAMQHGNIAPVDLAQAAIGPGMAVFSRHSKVLEPDGSQMGVRTALGLINQVLGEILAEQEGEFDPDTRWAIAWYEQFGFGDGAYGTAETLSKAKNTSVAGLVEAGIVAASRGRVRLLARAEYTSDWDPAADTRVPVWEATQRIVHALLAGGEAEAADLLARLGGLGDTARDLAYLLYQLANRKGWTDDAGAYNALVVAWTDLARGAESTRAAQPAQASLGLE